MQAGPPPQPSAADAGDLLTAPGQRPRERGPPAESPSGAAAPGGAANGTQPQAQAPAPPPARGVGVARSHPLALTPSPSSGGQSRCCSAGGGGASPPPPAAAASAAALRAARHLRSATLADSSDLEEAAGSSSSSYAESSCSPAPDDACCCGPAGRQLEPQQPEQLQQEPQQQPDEQQQAKQGEQQLQQQQQQQQRQQDGGGGSGSRAPGRQRTVNGDPDYELPQGRLTETQVLLSHPDPLCLDRYGFIVPEAEAAARAASAPPRRTPAQARRDQQRLAKWRRMLGGGRGDFAAYCASRPRKVKRRVRQGIPDEFRGLVWQYLSGGRELMSQHPGRYAALLTQANDPADLEIMRDLNRTFPNHVFFHQRQGPGQRSLFHVLKAYSAHDRVVGYVQGMGFVAAVLLMYMGEEEAFWTLAALLKGAQLQPPLEGLYQAGMPLLRQCLYQFQELLKQENPRLGGHLEQEGVAPSMYCTHWFNTIFAYSLPFEQLLRVWDVFLLEGMKVVFRVGIALLGSAQEELLAMPFERLVAALNGRQLPLLGRPPDALMRAALRIPVSRRLELLRERWVQLAAEAEAGAAAAGGGAAACNGGAAHALVAPLAMGPSR